MIRKHETSSGITGSASCGKERIDPDDVGTMLAAELNQMTFQEREKINEELHGVHDVIEESEELVAQALREMDLILQVLPSDSIYDKARSISSGYVEDRSFRLMFLRSEYFNPQLAAKRLIKFLENKVTFFGEETLARPIYLSDLNNDDIAVLKSGIVQLIPARDRSGRVIISDFNMDDSLEQPKDISNYIKAVAYLILAAAEDDETQKRGIISMFYFTNVLPLVQKLYERRPKLFDWLPIKLVGGHICYGDPRFRIIHALLLVLMGKKRRVRVRMHEGSHTECQYKLMTFGVPVNHFPVTYEGTLKTLAHAKWLSRRVVKEAAMQSVGKFAGIDLPHVHDVLLGRGKTVQEHSGNVILRRLIADNMHEYRNVPKKEKGLVAWKVMQAVKVLGGRFLKRQPDGWWIEVSDEVAREKISMTYRTSRSSVSVSESHIDRVEHSANNAMDRLDLLEPRLKRLKESHPGEKVGVVDYSSNKDVLTMCNTFCLGVLES